MRTKKSTALENRITDLERRRTHLNIPYKKVNIAYCS